MASPQKADGARRMRAVRLCAPEVVIDRRADGTLYLKSPHQLDSYAERLTDRLAYWAETSPDRIFMAERDGDSRRMITYAQTLERVRRIGEALLKKRLSVDRPIVILSGNDLEHALLGLAANYVGIPYAPVSPAYSLISSDFGKLRHIINLLTPGLVFASDGAQYARAIEAVVPPDVEVVVSRPQTWNRPTTLLVELLAEPTVAVDMAHANVTPDTIAKFLFTSGSTGMPKGVVNTQRMWCSNQQMLRSALQYFEDEPPVIVDWAPWHHTAGGNHDVGLVLYNGGTMHIDAGKPLPGAIEETVRNLKDIAPTWYFNVPKGYEALLPFFRADTALRENFFSRLKVLWFAGAGLAQHVFDEWKDLAYRTCGEDILFLTGLGSTETAPYAFGRMWDAENSANIGLPPPGLEVKLVPFDGKYEARLRGPNITPGYWREPALTAEAFDAEGFYKLGDALKFDDPAIPEKGLLFDGRIAEDFKLATGTWVSVGPLRVAFIAHCAPYVKDVVIAGADRDDIAILIFPDIEACRRLAPDLARDAAAADIVAHESVRREFRFLLDGFAKAATGSSNRIMRAILLDAPPSLDLGEATDKGSINQRMVLRHRAALVQELYAPALPARVIAIGAK